MSAAEVRLICGDALTELRKLPAGCCRCCVTSPPYFALRDYGTGTWEGGDAGCDHRKITALDAGSRGSGLLGGKESNGHQQEGYRDTCGKCGAVRIDQQLGLEATPEQYVARLVEVFREVRRVLADDGCLFLNLGDSYASGASGMNGTGSSTLQSSMANCNPTWIQGNRKRAPTDGFKPKDLLGMPWQVAFALRADGWYLRSAMPWVKRSAMPESVTDRPSSALEYVFLLAKSERYYFDQEAVRKEGACVYRSTDFLPNSDKDKSNNGIASAATGASRAPRSGELVSGRNLRNTGLWFESLSKPWGAVGVGDEWVGLDITSKPYPEAHFACVDQETECLTLNGWKRHSEIQAGDVAAQFDIESGLLSWGQVEQVAVYHVENEPMICAQHRDLGMMLTPNHRTIIHRRHPRTRNYQAPVVIRADGLKCGHAIPVSAPWKSAPANDGIGSDWAELLGWYIAEGYECKVGWGVDIYQSFAANPEKVNRIRSLLLSVGAEFREATTARTWDGRSAALTAFNVRGYVAIRLRELAPQKTLSWGLLGLPEEELSALLDGLILGDGHTRPEDGRRSFIQRTKATADFVQALAVRLGYATKLSYAAGTYRVYITSKRLISLRGTNGKGTAPALQPYTGVVWCPKLPLGTWVARRNGRVFITGNTFPEALPAVCIRAGTSQKGKCPHCGAAWVREVERESRPNRPTAPNDDRRERHIFGWSPSCCCPPAEPIPEVVLDPFAGTATTGVAALKLGRHFLGIELSPQYLELARKRLAAPLCVGTLFDPDQLGMFEEP